MSMNRREFLKTGAAGLCALSLAGGVKAAEGKKRPNVLLITTDQQRVDAMSAVGNKWAKTPNMDSIAANGVYFKKSYTAYPLCSPARTSLHTGRTPHEAKVDRNNLPIDPTLKLSGNIFQDAGYDTGYSGKWHMPETYPMDPNAIAGFETLNKTGRTGKLAKDVDEATMNQAIEFLKRKRDKPFFLTVSFINPHDICLLAGEDSPILNDVMARYMPKDGAEIPPLPENHEMPAGAPALANRPKHPDWDEKHWRGYRYAYFRMVEDVDRQVGQVLAALREIGQEDNTLIVFTSDHGEGLGCHKWTGKMMYFDDEAGVPLIVSWKGVTPAGRIDDAHLVGTLDVLPTICDYAGLQPPEKMRGASLRPVIDKPETPGHEFMASEMAGGGGGQRSHMIRTKKYKYMVFPGNSAAEMFFDMEADPLEMKNLAAEPAMAAEVERHRKLLAQWCAETQEEKYPIVAGGGGRPGKKKARQAAKAGAGQPKAEGKAKGGGGKKKGQGKKKQQ